MLAEDAALTTDGVVRIAAASCVLGLCESEAGSKHLQECGFKEVLRGWEVEEGEASAKTMLKKALATLEESQGKDCPTDLKKIEELGETSTVTAGSSDDGSSA